MAKFTTVGRVDMSWLILLYLVVVWVDRGHGCLCCPAVGAAAMTDPEDVNNRLWGK